MKVSFGDIIGPAEKETQRRSVVHKPRHFENFIDAYLEYTSGQESTTKIQTWVGISIIAAALERKVRFKTAYFTIFPNLYIFIIGESGVIRKSTSTGIGVDLLRDIETVNIMAERLTSASLIAQLERAHSEFAGPSGTENQCSIFAYASELVVFLNEVFGSISELLTTFYDCSPNDPSKPWVYETKGEGEIKIYGPCLNLLGASTPTWLLRAIPPEEMEGGFSSRVIFVVETKGPERYIAWPQPNKKLDRMRKQLVSDLNQIHLLAGNFDKTHAAHTFYEEWYNNYKRGIFNRSKDDPRFKGYYGRKATTVIKVAMILAVSEGNTLVFDQRHIEKAVGLLENLEQTMFDAFGNAGKNQLAEDLAQIREIIKIRKRISHAELFGIVIRNLNGTQFQQIIVDLTKSGQIKPKFKNKDQIIYEWTGEKIERKPLDG